MNINWNTILNVVLGLAIFKVLDVLFLGEMLTSLVGPAQV